MIPPAFDYHAPRTIAEAISLLSSLGDDAKLLAGGHSLLPMMKLRFAQPGTLIDINRIPELRGISESGGVIRIGAMTSENELIASSLLQKHLPLLPEAALLIADPQVRNRGTIGGDIAHGDPGNDHPAGWSLPGSPWAISPPMVPRLRTCGSAISSAASGSKGRCFCKRDEAISSFSLVMAPMRMTPPLSLMPRNSGMRLMSISVPGCAKRSFIIGSRLWPPANSLASSPKLESREMASAMVRGAW